MCLLSQEASGIIHYQATRLQWTYEICAIFDRGSDPVGILLLFGSDITLVTEFFP